MRFVKRMIKYYSRGLVWENKVIANVLIVNLAAFFFITRTVHAIMLWLYLHSMPVWIYSEGLYFEELILKAATP